MDLPMDALVLQHGRVHYSCWTRKLKSLNASTEVAGRVQSELRLRPSKSGGVQLLLRTRFEPFKNASRRVCTASTKCLDASGGGVSYV